MKTPLLLGEVPIRDGMASLQRGLETVGGWLYLTSQRLIFEPHAINLQSVAATIALADVFTARPCWTKFLGLIPLFPNSLAVTTQSGQELRLVLFGRRAWSAAIQRATKAAGG